MNEGIKPSNVDQEALNSLLRSGSCASQGLIIYKKPFN